MLGPLPADAGGAVVGAAGPPGVDASVAGSATQEGFPDIEASDTDSSQRSGLQLLPCRGDIGEPRPAPWQSQTESILEDISPAVSWENDFDRVSIRRRLFAKIRPGRLRETTRAEHIERALNSWQIQTLLLGVSVLYSAGLFTTALDGATENDLELAEWIFITGAVLIALTSAEFCVLVHVQAGLRHFWHFFWPLFHKLLAFVMVVLLVTVIEATFVRMAEEGKSLARVLPILPDSNGDRYRITTGVVLFYRALRFWAIRYKISVAATLRARRRRRAEDVTGVWADDHKRRIEEHARRVSVRLQACMDRWPMQVFFLFAVVVYGYLYAATVSWASTKQLESMKDLYVLTNPLGYTLLCVFMLELVLRCLAQEGERFFTPLWHKIEILFLMLGLFFLGYGSWYSNAFRQDEHLEIPMALITAVLLLFHRILRIIGLRFEVQADEHHAHNVMSGAVREWLKANCGDALDIPAKNIRVTYENGIRLVIYKAMVKPEVLEDLHLPITPKRVYVEEMEVVLPQISTLFRKFVEGAIHKQPSDAAGQLKNTGRSVLRVKGAVVLLEPGSGLKEAGAGAGVVRRATTNVGDDFDDDCVEGSSDETRRTRMTFAGFGFQSPANLAEIAARFTSRARDSSRSSKRSRRTTFPRASSDSRDTRTPKRMSSSLSKASMSSRQRRGPYWTYERLLRARANLLDIVDGQLPWLLQSSKEELRLVVDRCLAAWEVDIRPFRVQYSDPEGLLGDGLTAVSLNVGTCWARWRQGHAFACDITRVSLRVEPGSGTSTADDLSDAAQTEDVLLSNCEASRLDPRLYMAFLRHESTLERLRLWALEGMARQKPLSAEQRHLREERRQPTGPGTVLCLLWVRVLAGKGANAPGPPADEKDLDAWVGESQEEVEDRSDKEAHSRLFKVRGEGRPLVGPRQCPGGLTWRMQTHPIRISVDNEQVRCLRTIALCTQAWLLRDYAFRWRPGVSLEEAEQLQPTERSTVTRMWWLYAVHRVLADLVCASPRALGSAWLEANRHQRAELLANLSRRKKRQPWEQRWLEELQIQLPLEDVIKCRVRAFLEREKHHIEDFPVEDLRLALSGHWTLFVPAVDVRILRRPPAPAAADAARAVLCHLRLEALAVDAVEPLDPATEPRKLTTTIGDIVATCPIGAEFTLGVPKRICWVERPLDHRPASGRHLQGCWSLKPKLFLELRVAVPANFQPSLELRVAPLRAVILEPLVVELARIFGPLASADLAGVGAQGRSLVEQVAATEAAYRLSGGRMAKLARQFKLAPTEPLDVANGRPIGPFAESFRLYDTEAALNIAKASSELLLRARAVRHARAVAEELKLEAVAFGALAAGAAWGRLQAWDADVSIGHVGIAQVGEYSRASLLVEDYELGPVHIRGQKPEGQVRIMIEQLDEPELSNGPSAWFGQSDRLGGSPPPAHVSVGFASFSPVREERGVPAAAHAGSSSGGSLLGWVCSLGKPCGGASVRCPNTVDFDEADINLEFKPQSDLRVSPDHTPRKGTALMGICPAEAEGCGAERRGGGAFALTVRTIPRRRAFGAISCI